MGLRVGIICPSASTLISLCGEQEMAFVFLANKAHREEERKRALCHSMSGPLPPGLCSITAERRRGSSTISLFVPGPSTLQIQTKLFHIPDFQAVPPSPADVRRSS